MRFFPFVFYLSFHFRFQAKLKLKSMIRSHSSPELQVLLLKIHKEECGSIQSFLINSLRMTAAKFFLLIDFSMSGSELLVPKANSSKEKETTTLTLLNAAGGWINSLSSCSFTPCIHSISGTREISGDGTKNVGQMGKRWIFLYSASTSTNLGGWLITPYNWFLHYGFQRHIQLYLFFHSIFLLILKQQFKIVTRQNQNCHQRWWQLINMHLESNGSWIKFDFLTMTRCL